MRRRRAARFLTRRDDACFRDRDAPDRSAAAADALLTPIGTSPCDKGAALILMYHRVGFADHDPWGLAVEPERFEKHLARLRALATPTPLTAIAASVDKGESPGRLVAVTFDDGYADNLHVAAPLLARYGIPATIFVATEYVGADREFWWDELERVLLTPAALPRSLTLSIGAEQAKCDLDGARFYTSDDRRADRAWFLDKRGDPSPRFAFFRSIHRRLMSAREDERRAALGRIRHWAGDAGGARPDRLCVSREELRCLAHQQGVTLGAHTVTHAELPVLPAAEQQWEMRYSREALEAMTGRRPQSFAYPYGAHSGETVEIVRGEGFALACSTRPGAVDQHADVFSLPRVKVGDWDEATFEKTLSAFLAPTR